MTEEEFKENLKENLKLARQNNKILRKMESRHKWSRFFKAVYLIVFLVIIFAAYYYIQPIVSELRGFAGQASESVDQLRNIGDLIQ